MEGTPSMPHAPPTPIKALWPDSASRQTLSLSPQPPPPANTSVYTGGLPTPIKAHRLRHHLHHIGYNIQLTNYLVDGFLEGFSIGNSAEVEDIWGPNSRHVRQNATVVADKLETEILAGRIVGPFNDPPFSPFHISPLNVRPKKSPNKYRLLHNLSYPYDGNSINSNIPAHRKTVQYASVGDAISGLLTLPRHSYTAKTDIADAFRLIPVHPTDYPKLGMRFRGKYYYDRNLPQGCSSSCQIFEAFSTALHSILVAYDSDITCVHMLDDFFLMSADHNSCAAHLRLLLDLCDDIGVPMSPEKTTTPCQNTTFLGVELDTNLQIAKLPLAKLQEYSTEVRATSLRSKIRRKELESLVGKLNFAASVVPARPFLRRLIDLIHTVDKPYHYIRITQCVKQDLLTWLDFLMHYNGITYFRSLNKADPETMHMVSDASKLGFGACFGSKWLQAEYPASWQEHHITILELYPIFVLINIFGGLMKNSTILFHCDNSAVTAIINKQSSKDRTAMTIVRPLVLFLVQHNICLRSKHIPGVLNVLSDKISRFQVTPSLLRDHGMDAVQTPIPRHLLPINYILG